MKIKQDINFLEYPLWFPVPNSDENGMIWRDRIGYIYRAGYKSPDKTDAIILFYLLLKSQENDYKQKMKLSRYEILKECGFPNDGWYRERLEDSLRRWNNVSIEFKGAFYDGQTYKTIGFHVLSNYRIGETKDKRVTILFDKDFLLKIKESSFFKYINFNQYKAIKRPVSLRLFEELCKSFKGRDVWEIDLVKLGTKLPLSKRKVHFCGEEKEIMYHSDVLVKLKPAINEINKLAENEELFRSFEFTPKDVFGINYELRNNNKIIVFKKVTPEWLTQQKKAKKTQRREILIQIKDPLLKELFSLSKSQNEGIKTAIKNAYQSKGADYTRSNILYANKEAKKNYGVFLKKALKEDWGAELREESLKQLAYEKTKEEERAKKKQEIKEVAQKVELLTSSYQSIDPDIIDFLTPIATNQLIDLGLPKDFIPKVVLMDRIVELYLKKEYEFNWNKENESSK